MDLVCVRLECLKLAVGKVVGREPDEIVTLAKHFEAYIVESTSCSPEKSGQNSGTLEQKPNDPVKEQQESGKGWLKQNSKK